MIAQWTPMRWPSTWKDPSAVGLLKGAAIDCLLIDAGDELEPVRSAARQQGLKVAATHSPPVGVAIVKGAWPGVKMARGGANQLAAGPTGVPWVDSNGFVIRLQAALHPETEIWVDAPPKDSFRFTGDSYLVGIADCAAHGGRWIISLDDALTVGLTAQKPDAQATWTRITAAAAFFAAHKAWAGYLPVAVAGVISDFSGPNEFFSRELLNLLARAGLHYRIVRKDSAAATSFDGLRAVIYADAQPPSGELRKAVMAFVHAGGTLITDPRWGAVADAAAKGEVHPRFSVSTAGKGKVAIAKAVPDDPYLLANDSVVLVSHRYDLVRFWNGGSTGSLVTMAPGGKQTIVHLLFYANRGPDSASVRIAGRFRSVKASTVDVPVVPDVHTEWQKDAVEVHLPQVSQYVALELGV